jgi:hypothetical protein
VIDGQTHQWPGAASARGFGRIAGAHSKLVGADRYDLGLGNGDHRKPVPDGIKHFEAVARFLARPFGMMLDYSTVAMSPLGSPYCGR